MSGRFDFSDTPENEIGMAEHALACSSSEILMLSMEPSKRRLLNEKEIDEAILRLQQARKGMAT